MARNSGLKCQHGFPTTLKPRGKTERTGLDMISAILFLYSMYDRPENSHPHE